MESNALPTSFGQRVARHRKKLVVLLVALLVVEAMILGLWFLLSPKYEYHTLSSGQLGKLYLRKNKSSGETQIWSAGRWQKIEFTGNHFEYPEGMSLAVGSGSPPDKSTIPRPVLIGVIVAAIVEIAVLGVLAIGGRRRDQTPVPVAADNQGTDTMGGPMNDDRGPVSQ
jgi:hypothetical protein